MTNDGKAGDVRHAIVEFADPDGDGDDDDDDDDGDNGDGDDGGGDGGGEYVSSGVASAPFLLQLRDGFLPLHNHKQMVQIHKLQQTMRSPNANKTKLENRYQLQMI